ncbi:MAG: transketolase family protein [Patescibacteria group bacterium]|nr:transketolase family protein [Patescibacteria group bacterium]MDE2438548.1 transketolase family protein [Patescibacteria group bacterium]
MLNADLKLSPHLFKDNLESAPLRDGYGTGVVRAGERDSNVVVLCADLTESTRSLGFAEKFPDRFFEIGVAEQNLATIAAGLGVSGKIPFISSYATFSPGRNWEQIRTTIAYNHSNVKIIGSHAGISVGPDGATHQAIEDIATMRAIPTMKVFVPCDVHEADRITYAIASLDGPCYVRLAREKTPVVTTEHTPFEFGKVSWFWLPHKEKFDVTVFVAGPLMYHALQAAQMLEREGVDTAVVNVATVKPLDEEGVEAAVVRSGAGVVVEEHQILGGLGGAIAECVAKRFPVPLEFIGMQDTFGESGPPDALIEKYGMGVTHIVAAAKRVILRKRK